MMSRKKVVLYLVLCVLASVVISLLPVHEVLKSVLKGLAYGSLVIWFFRK